MPILKQEPAEFPEGLLDSEGREETRLWRATYTKARQEKSLARDLLAYQIPFYLPLVSKKTLVRGRRVESLSPLFSGYVFLYCTDDERYKSLTTNRISQVVEVKDQERLWSDLRNLKRLIVAKAPMTIESRLAPGQRVRVKSGPFMGVEGTIESRRGAFRLIVEVSFLQQGVSVEIDDFQVEPI